MTEENQTFLIDQEDHTFGNLIRTFLLKDPDVIFAAYRVPHPLTRSVEIKIQTLNGTAEEAFQRACDAVLQDLDELQTRFDLAAKTFP